VGRRQEAPADDIETRERGGRVVEIGRRSKANDSPASGSTSNAPSNRSR